MVFISLMALLPSSIKAHVALDYPVGGETFIVGQTITIEWHIVAPHEQLNWDLFYSMDGGDTWDTIQLDIPTSNLSYEWVIPNNLTSIAQIQIFQDNVGQNYLDVSMDFTIAPNTSPPSLDAPANNLEIECNTSTQQAIIEDWLNNNGGAYATNYCGELIWTNDYPGLSNGCAATGTALVTFTATDECGMTMTIAILTVMDTSPPSFQILPSDVVVETDGLGNQAELVSWLNTHAGSVASDDCGGISWSNDFIGLNDDCGTTGNVTVNFIVTDECGNSNSASSTFTIVDQVAPVITTNAQDTIFECAVLAPEDQIEAWLNNHGGAEGFDTGSNIEWTNNFSGLSDGCGPTGEAIVVFTATDECGNTATTAASIAVEDHGIPEIIHGQGTQYIECGDPALDSILQNMIDVHGGASAIDLCSQVTWTSGLWEQLITCGSAGGMYLIYTATDECGNKNETFGDLIIRDLTAPTIIAEARDTTILCTEGLPSIELKTWLNNNGGAVASDLCGDVTWSNNFPFPPHTCGPMGVYDIQFIATDECGNTASTHATLTIIDAISPGVEDHQKQLFKVYPNPAQDELFIDLHDIAVHPKQIDLMDSYGNIVWSSAQITGIISVNVNHLPGGMYFLCVAMQEGVFFKKVILH